MNILNPFVPDPADTLMITIAREFEKILEKGAVGKPIKVGDHTMVPLLITTFGIGVGGGSLLGEPVGGGGGGGVIPCAVVVFGPNGVDLLPLSPDLTKQTSDAILRMVRETATRFPKSRTTETVPA